MVKLIMTRSCNRVKNNNGIGDIYGETGAQSIIAK